ncbi:MAG: beta-lactamase family protein, partial [Prevotellaceae bacterium]|jgi:CubicO group peptidase (beta-lactamase class C family)|nr:beta-lactamase family protein [Prevotellaceae bacterium]
VGYAILGRIIEKISGESYEEYVRKNVLYPIGIRNMRIGRSYPKDKYPDEVMYYDVWDAKRTPAFDNPNQYVFKPEGGHDIYTLGAAGGWVATSVDILRFILCIDGLPAVPDILSQKSITQMVLNDDKYDPIGWRFADARSWIRTGTLAGTSAVAVRDGNGFCWVVLTNTSSWTGSMFPFKIYYFMRDLIEKEHLKWTMDYDFFETSRYTQPINIRRDNLQIEKKRK